jgi:hypothetical protein
MSEQLRYAPPATVLLVENDILERVSKAALLRRQGFEVFEAADTAEAVTVLKKIAVDILISEIARWLLMWHDRVGGDTLIVTHELLALLLGVHRPGVTDALHGLESKGLIRTTRSHIHIRNRNGLQLVAKVFYGLPEAEYDRSLGRKG